MRKCERCRGKILCATCNNQINENKGFEAILNLLKRELLTNLVKCFPIL